MKNYGLEFMTHHLIGGNPDRLDGTWDTPNQAMTAFAVDFERMTENAHSFFLFIRKQPVLQCENAFDTDMKRYKMIGRFSVVKATELSNEN